MPYISKEQREALEHRTPEDVGELTYELTAVVLRYLRKMTAIRTGVSPCPTSFQDYAEVLGALEATKLELYRREIAPYEDIKVAVNGDVFV